MRVGDRCGSVTLPGIEDVGQRCCPAAGGSRIRVADATGSG